MKEFMIYRGGRPAENQGGLAEKPVLRVQANDPDEACRTAAAQVAVEPGQWLFAKPVEELDVKEQELNLRAEALETKDE